MRQIKFRAKTKATGEWIEGYPFPLYHNQEGRHKSPHWLFIPKDVNISKSRCIGSIQVEVDPNTIGQFTGLKDNNDKEIYEGDIIRFKYEDYSEYNINGYHHPVEVISAVTFEWGSYNIDGYPGRLGACYDWADDECEFEVIGNIYDNPELIKK